MKVFTLNRNEFKVNCNRLFSQIEIKPDLVIGILNGGGFVLEEFKKVNKKRDIVYETIKIQRASTHGLKKNSIVQSVLKLMSYTVLDKMRIVEHKKYIKEMVSNKTESISLEFKKAHKAIEQILILDDALDTGQTIKSVVNAISSKYPKAEVKIGVVAWTYTNSVVKPDYYIIKGDLVRFPWSLDYKTQPYE